MTLTKTPIPTGLVINSQIPLDNKLYFLNEASLSNLGELDNFAFIYYKGMVAYCAQEDTSYKWKEIQEAEEGLLNNNFIYPDNWIKEGINYSNKEYNFVAVTSGTETKISAGTNVTITGSGTDATPYVINASGGTTVSDATSSLKGILRLTGDLGGTADAPTTPTAVHKTGNETIQGVKQVINSLANQSRFNFITGSDSTSPSLTVSALSSIVPGIKVITSSIGADGIEAIVGTGGGNAIILKSNLTGSGATNSTMLSFDNVLIDNDVTPIRIKKQGVEVSKIDYLGNITANSYIKPGGTSTQTLMADGSVKENQDNLQKVITYPTDFTGTNYTLTNADNNYEIIIDNGATAVTITVPSGLTSKIGVGFTQKGTGDISYTASGTTINNPIGLKIKGQYYQTYLSQELSTNNYFLGGNTKI